MWIAHIVFIDGIRDSKLQVQKEYYRASIATFCPSYYLFIHNYNYY